MNLFNLLESPKLGAPSNTPGAQDIGDQHSPSPIGSGTSKREAKKKPVTIMGASVTESKVIEVWETITEGLRPGEYYNYLVTFDDGTTTEINVASDEFDFHSYYAKKGKNVTSVKQQGGIRSDFDEGVTEAGPFSYGAKKPRKGSVADLAAKKRKEQERGKKPIEPRDQMVGVAKVLTKDVTEGVANVPWNAVVEAILYDQFDILMNRYGLTFDDIEHIVRQHGFDSTDAVKAAYSEQGVAEGSVQDKLHQRHQELRKKSGLPDPNYYKELKATYDLPDEERYTKAAELKKKYNVKEDILDRAAPKLPKPRNPAEKILTAKRTSGAAGKHVNKKRQAQLQPKHRGRDDLDESLKSKLAGAALAGALATGAAAGNLPDLVGKVTMDIDGQQVTKEFNLGNDYASPMAAQKDLEKFLRSKGVNNFYIQLERAAPDNKFQPQDTRPGPYGARSVSGPGGVVDTAGQVAGDVEGGNLKGAAEKAYKTYQQNKNADLGAVGRGELKDRIVKGVVGGLGFNESESLDEDIERHLRQLQSAGYDVITESATLCPECGGVAYSDKMLAEKQDACYHKVKSRYKVWPSAYASGALVRCRKVGASNWGNKSKK